MSKTRGFLLTAGLVLATAFTLSCGQHEGNEPSPDVGDGGSSSSDGGGGVSSSSGGGGSSSSGEQSSSSLTQREFTYGELEDKRDSKKYKTIEIGTQTWMAENLNFKEEKIGPTRGSKCYDDKESNCEKYGRLYEWDDALEVCPAGWHLPSNAEWDALITFVGANAGKKLRAIDSVWTDGIGTDDYGFSALPGGLLSDEFTKINTTGYWWTATERNGREAHDGINKQIEGNDVGQDWYGKTRQLSVRCVLGSSSSSSITYGELEDKRDNKKYKTIEIGTQTWMAENLNFKEEKIGPTRGSKCYDDKESNCDKYGRLYEWDDAVEVCPAGWHLPSVAEWDALITFVGDNAGRKLKAKASDWGDGYGIDNYGFSALPSGGLFDEFTNINVTGYWWTATEYNAGSGRNKQIEGTKNDVGQDYYDKTRRQLPVRCVLGSSSSSSITYGELEDKRDNKKYKTIEIGTQTWMAENLNFKEEKIGPTRGSKCYDDKESNCEKYGRLYEWDDAVEVCPAGWHLPSVAEWDALITFVGDNAGKKLKAKASDWGDGYGRDNYGFSALPSGLLSDEFTNINVTGYWWTATEYNAGSGRNKQIEGTRNDVGQNYYDKIRRQLPVRCVLGPSSSSSITYGSFTDTRDSKEYKTIEIGTQTWMAENLNFKEEQIGPTRGSKCYDDNESNCEKYGRLYEWYDALEICPDGWHLPSVAEWNTLITSVGDNAGKKLKAKASDWGDGYGRDNYGFSALPSGGLFDEFADINLAGYWWTTMQNGTWSYESQYKKITENGVQEFGGRKTNQLSVRCVLGSSSSSSITYGELEDERDSKKYRTVRIGSQNWMAENLNFETENGSVCYDSKESNCDNYGRLYDWETAKTVCPSGWELPSVSEWNALISYVGYDAHKKLKAKASNWGDGYGIDKYGFSALPSGGLFNEFADINLAGYWWTTTPNGTWSYEAQYKGITKDDVREWGGRRTNQLSVRCIEK